MHLLLHLHVLGFGLLEDGDVGIAFPEMLLDQSDFLLSFLQKDHIGIVVPPQNSETFAVR